MPDEPKSDDALLDQADALLRRPRGAASLITASGDDLAADDLPLLTEVVDESTPPAAFPPSTPSPRADRSDRLAGLDGLIAREVEAWLAEELPPILAEEFERLAEQVRLQALARMRSTLLPALSRHVATLLEQEADPAP